MRAMMLTCACAGLIWAQGSGEVFEKQVRADFEGTRTFVMMEVGPGAAVKNAPYSAQVATEMTQVLADGNRIVNKTSGALARDSEGRTRRETNGEQGLQVFITDPVAQVNYMLDTRRKIAHRFGGVVGGIVGGVPGGVAGGVRVAMPREGGVPGGGGGVVNKASVEQAYKMAQEAGVKVAREKREKPAAKTEDLGVRSIEGVQAEGTRTTTTIAAGAIGNEKPIEIVSERWYSPQLQTVILITTKDPRMGESVYKLTNLSLAEPAHALFEVPPDYTLEQRK